MYSIPMTTSFIVLKSTPGLLFLSIASLKVWSASLSTKSFKGDAGAVESRGGAFETAILFLKSTAISVGGVIELRAALKSIRSSPARKIIRFFTLRLDSFFDSGRQAILNSMVTGKVFFWRS
jgi:hypothetical protein